jgi:hypothetical protein
MSINILPLDEKICASIEVTFCVPKKIFAYRLLPEGSNQVGMRVMRPPKKIQDFLRTRILLTTISLSGENLRTFAKNFTIG